MDRGLNRNVPKEDVQMMANTHEMIFDIVYCYTVAN